MTIAGAHNAETAWPSWLPLCCAPLTSCAADKKSRRIDEKSQYPVIHEQPLHHPRPVAMPDRQRQGSIWDDMGSNPRMSATQKRGRFWSFSSTSTRRPLISAPSDFQHVYSASPQLSDFPEPTPSRASNLRPAKQLPKRESSHSFRPLQLSFNESNRPMSPMMPYLGLSPSVPSTPVNQTPDHSHQLDGSRPLEHQKSFSTSPMSFHFPRRNLLENSPSTSLDDVPPLIPPKSRGRAYSSPDVNQIKERVASAMIEVEKLQKQIDDVIERQSLYIPSRPSSPRSLAACTMPDLEPMPSIPALPPAAPSFAERLNSEIGRPHTAPIKTPPQTPTKMSFHHPRRSRTPGAVSARPHTPPPRPRRDDDRPPPPPIPSVLRPPLRKKKSFSHVSSWLFPDNEAEQSLSMNPNANRATTNKGLDPSTSLDEVTDESRQPKSDSVDTVTTWESEDEEPTVPTTCSMGSTPAISQDESLLSRFATFGKRSPSRRTSVGVAM